MSLHYQVYADFTLTNGKPQLVSTSISSTRAGCSRFPFYPFDYSLLTISCIFPTLQNAHSYIAYLHGVWRHGCRCNQCFSVVFSTKKLQGNENGMDAIFIATPPPVAYLRYEDSGQKNLFQEEVINV